MAAIVVLVLDRVTKFWVTHSLELGQQVFPSWPAHITYTVNSGAAFSILPQAEWLFLAVALLVVLAVAWRWELLAQQAPWVQVGVGMLLGGAVANAIDRITQGYVVDFIQFPHFPVFNLADAGITLGVILIVIRIAVYGGAGG